MNQGEYLQNKQRKTPKIFGPAKMGDESTRIMVHRFLSSTITKKHSPQVQCCRTYPNGVGYRQVSSRDAITSKTAGCEICAAGPPRYKHSITDCSSCTILTPYTYDTPVQKAAALMGKQTCCASPPYVPRNPAPCCVEPGYINTFAANNVPSDSIPVAPALGQCCDAPVKIFDITAACCDDSEVQ
jgi:hypothetical protein